MNQYPPPQPPPYAHHPAPPGPPQWQGHPPPVQAAPPRRPRTAVIVVLALALPALGIAAALLEISKVESGPGSEEAEAPVRANVPVTLNFESKALFKHRVSIWLRHTNADARLEGQIDCHEVGGENGVGGVGAFPSVDLLAHPEPEPGVIMVASGTIRHGARVTCAGTMTAPVDLAGRLVVTEHWPRPSDILGL